ncbi:acyl-CoA dehydrogenase family protein (plasmid) [Natrinema zhouii]|uniref:acyl-CoA dehydrogenase family protein n=1 Tax=Natrinema zhouii TaxID=1710539 RepID=UPI001CFFBB18|nr:acyl-CoA dehydrogenase family protein [Natrinema zhouii]UHQ98840.1 acyl-CoA dehydrogenase family protein [Natrinema zhouii]UHQ98862.1 acyl-CoA dehydrogenase family protein [Natrinema zhouii]
MDFRRSDEQELIYQAAIDIATDQFAEKAFTWEDEFPYENQKILAEQDLLGIGLPMEYGGGGYSVVEVLIAQEAVGRVCPDTAHILSRSSMGPPRAIAELGSEYLKEKYLSAVCDGNSIISVAISEAEAGSDASNMQTSVERDGDELILNGSKMWVTKAAQCDAFLVYARFPDDNIGAIVVDKDTDGLTLDDGSVNMAGHVQHQLYFDDCTVHEDQVLVHEKDAFKRLLIEFNVERCHNAMMCVACGLNAFDKALDYAKNREQFDQPVADFQGIEWKLADMAMELDASRLLIYRAAANARESDPSRLETSMAKVKANEVGQEVVDESMQIHGANGYMKDSPIEYLYRWVRGWKIAGGTVEVQRNAIASELKKYGLD